MDGDKKTGGLEECCHRESPVRMFRLESCIQAKPKNPSIDRIAVKDCVVRQRAVPPGWAGMKYDWPSGLAVGTLGQKWGF